MTEPLSSERQLTRERDAYRAVLERVEHFFFEKYGLADPISRIKSEDEIIVFQRIQEVLRDRS